jgi:hypothetical protein
LSAPDNVLRYEECWAKTTTDGRPGISVRDHCLNVGCVAEALLELLPDHLHGLLPPGAATLAALHDVGKVSPGFQSKCEKWLVWHGLSGRVLKQVDLGDRCCMVVWFYLSVLSGEPPPACVHSCVQLI